MLYLLCVLLVVAAVLLVVVGAATSSALPYVGAAIFSAVVVVLLWRRIRGTRENVFVTDPPASVPSQWDRPIRRATREPVPEGVEVPPVSIPHYDDLVAAEVLPSLETLSVDELQMVILHERYGMGRQAIIHRAEVLIDLTLGTGTARRTAGVARTSTALREPYERESEARVAPTEHAPAPAIDDVTVLPKPPVTESEAEQERMRAPEQPLHETAQKSSPKPKAPKTERTRKPAKAKDSPSRSKEPTNRRKKGPEIDL